MGSTLRWIAHSGLAIPLALALAVPARTMAREHPTRPQTARVERYAPPSSDRWLDAPRLGYATAAVSTTYITALYDFDTGPNCDMEGWTTVDLTLQTEGGFHVASGVAPDGELQGGTYGNLLPLDGDQSLWCGLPYDTMAFPQCGWVEAPGYGNNWNQIWKTRACVDVGTGVEVAYRIQVDSEYGYDATYVEVSPCGQGSWRLVDGGEKVFAGKIPSAAHTTSITGFDSTSIEIRFRFHSDLAWSDEDGLYVGDGAVLLDNLIVTDASGTLVPLETFEDEAPGAIETEDWHRATAAPFGDYAGLYWGWNPDVLQEDPCWKNRTCFWEFFDGAQTSHFDYACAPHHGGHPGVRAVPHGNVITGYISNEVWSPVSPWIGTGTAGNVEFDVYRDLPLDNLVFYVWHVRSVEGACVSYWRDRDFVYYGDDLAWGHDAHVYADLVAPGASAVQFAMGVVDMRGGWGPGTGQPVGSGACHSPAPYLDNFVAYRLPFVGPVWSVRDIDLFQDTFPRDGTLTGTGRADMAQDPAHGYTEPTYFPGDSAVVQSCTDHVSGLPAVTGPPYDYRPVYCFVTVRPFDAAKSGSNLDNTPYLLGLNRFVSVGTVAAEAKTWTQIQMDRVRDGKARPRRTIRPRGGYCIDLPDDLFEAGDTIEYFFGAHNTLNQWSYWSRETGTVYTMAEAARYPNEFQILPGAGPARGGDILYVDGMDGRGTQPYFDIAFARNGIYDLVDRFDVNGPSSGVSNRLGTRVYDPAQLVMPYRVIIWNTGDLSMTIGDGSGQPEKSNDWAVLDAFLSGLEAVDESGGLYLSGDDLPSVWLGQTGASAVAMRSWLHYSIPAGGNNHVPLLGVSPYGVGLAVAGNAFGDPASHPLGVDTLVAFGGCPAINDFDFMTPEGAATTQMEYRGAGDGGPESAAAIIGERTANPGGTVSVLMSGFSYHSIREDRLRAEMNRVHHLRDVLIWLGQDLPQPVSLDAGDGPRYQNHLAQNYPNPFNPTTTIAFTVRERTRVRLDVYDVTGALVRRLVDDRRAPGITHTVVWDGRDGAGRSVASGIYFYRLEAEGFERTRKMVVLK